MPWFERFSLRVMPAMLAVVLTSGLAGCGGDGSSESAATTTTERPSSTSRPTSTTGTSSTTTDTSSTTTDTSSTTTGGSGTTVTTAATSAEQEVIDRYVAYWAARFAANSGTPNPEDPALREYATGAQLDAVIAETQSNLDQGLAFQRAAGPHDYQRVTVVELDGDRAVVQECVVSDGVIVRRPTGEVVNDEVATHNVRGELARVDGVWRVSGARLVQRWEGVAGCARES